MSVVEPVAPPEEQVPLSRFKRMEADRDWWIERFRRTEADLFKLNDWIIDHVDVLKLSPSEREAYVLMKAMKMMIKDE